MPIGLNVKLRGNHVEARYGNCGLIAQRVCLEFVASELQRHPGSVWCWKTAEPKITCADCCLIGVLRHMRIPFRRRYLPYLAEMSDSLSSATSDLAVAAVSVHGVIYGGDQEQSSRNAVVVGSHLPPLLLPCVLMAVN